MIFKNNFSVLRNCTKHPDLRVKQYKHVRDVIVSQGYLAGVATVGACLVYNLGSEDLKKFAATTVVQLTPFGACVCMGKAIRVARKVGSFYKAGTMLYNVGMTPFKCIHFATQTPFMILDMVLIGEVYIPKLDAKWWNAGKVTDDVETATKWFVQKQ